MSIPGDDGGQSAQPPDQHTAPSPSAPGTVQAVAVLLYIGGTFTTLSALSGLGAGWSAGVLRFGGYLLLGLLYLGLGGALQGGKRWGRRAVLVLCGLGVVLAIAHLIAGDTRGGIAALVWPAVYAILLTTESARSWFRMMAQDPGTR